MLHRLRTCYLGGLLVRHKWSGDTAVRRRCSWWVWSHRRELLWGARQLPHVHDHSGRTRWTHASVPAPSCDLCQRYVYILWYLKNGAEKYRQKSESEQNRETKTNWKQLRKSKERLKTLLKTRLLRHFNPEHSCTYVRLGEQNQYNQQYYTALPHTSNRKRHTYVKAGPSHVNLFVCTVREKNPNKTLICGLGEKQPQKNIYKKTNAHEKNASCK